MINEKEFNEIELRLIRILMGQRSSAYGFDRFKSADLKNVKFSGNERGNMGTTDLVEQASDDAEMSSIEFYAGHDGSPSGRSIKININRYGRLSTGQSRGTRELVDRLNEVTSKVESYDSYFVSIDSRIQEFESDAYSPTDNVSQEIRRMNRAFNNLVEDYFKSISDEEKVVYASIAANVGIHLMRIQRLTDNRYPEANSKKFEELNHLGKIKPFFDFYRRYADQSASPDMDILADHLHNVLARQYDTPIKLVEYVENEYSN